MVPHCLVKMPGIPSFAFASSASLTEEEKPHNNNWRRNFPNGRNCWHSGKHEACRPNAYGMLLAGPCDTQDKCGGESPNEYDLAAMVEDFIENWHSKHEASSDSGLYQKGNIANAKISKLSESLQGLVSEISTEERNIQRYVIGLLLHVEAETPLPRVCSGENCDGVCIRQLLVKQLKLEGYNAAFCNTKWQSCGRIPAGEYKYIDVILNSPVGGSTNPVNRIIIDTDFRSQFQIARPTTKYQAALKVLPEIYIGRTERLMKIAQIMSKAAKKSLEKMSMYVPPWRTLEFMKAKWFSPCERLSFHRKSHLGSLPACCSQQLTHLKTSLKEETPTPSPSPNYNNVPAVQAVAHKTDGYGCCPHYICIVLGNTCILSSEV